LEDEKSATAERLSLIRSVGVRIAADDFGAARARSVG